MAASSFLYPLEVLRAVVYAVLIAVLRRVFDLVQPLLDLECLVHIGFPPSAIVRDHFWALVAGALRPFSRTYGYAERRALSRAMRLDPPLYALDVKFIETATVNEGKDVLRGALWLPKGQPGPFPTIVMRSPYGAQDKWNDWGQMFLAERGYAVLFQDTRGRFGSDGDFVPVEHEKADGAATVRWARAQPWCDGRVGVMGVSYLGFTAWAAVGACDDGELSVAIPIITQAVVRPCVFSPGGAVSLELLVLWFYLIEILTLCASPLKLMRNLGTCWWQGRLGQAFMVAPLDTLDEWLVGKRWDFFQRGVREPHDDDGPFWAERSTLCELRKGKPDCVRPPPLTSITGLHDFFAEQALVDFTRAAALQPSARLIVAPFSHWDFVSLVGWQIVLHAALHTVREHMPIAQSAPTTPADPPATNAAEKPPYPVEAAAPRTAPPLEPPWAWLTPGRSADDLAMPVQLCFLGSLRWRGFRSWPPPPARVLTLWLTAKHNLSIKPTSAKPALADGADAGADGTMPSPTPSSRSAPTTPTTPTTPRRCEVLQYTYTPSAPTPAAGGPSFNAVNAGGRSQRHIERRDDVLVFSSELLTAPLCLAGAAKLSVRVWASSRSVDIVARLCRVSKRGVSSNICEGLTRVSAMEDEPCIGAAPSRHASPVPLTKMQSWKERALGAFADADGAPTADEEAAAEGGGRLVTVVMSPLAVDVGVGEQLRLHVCSAAHPRWMRNLLDHPSTPLHAQVPSSTPCTVRLAVDGESALTLPVLEG